MNINNDILGIIVKHLQGKVSAQEQSQLEQWLADNPDHQQEYQKVADIWGASENLDADIDVDKEWNTFRAKHFDAPKKGKLIQADFRMVSRIAAAAVLIIGMFVLGKYIFGPQTYTTKAGERQLVNLEDGTTIILGENSTLSVPYTFNGKYRKVELLGEGFFTVAKNAAKPFEISGPKTGTRVLGTEFRLMTGDASNALQVSGGKVAYWQTGLQDTLILTQGEQGKLAQNLLVESTIKDPNFNSWYTGTFVFEDQPIAAVLDALQDHYVFDIKNVQALNGSSCRFSGKFKNQELEEILDELVLVTGLEYEWMQGTLSVSALSCK